MSREEAVAFVSTRRKIRIRDTWIRCLDAEEAERAEEAAPKLNTTEKAGPPATAAAPEDDYASFGSGAVVFGKNDPGWGGLSNFAPAAIEELDEESGEVKSFATAEHYFQHHKIKSVDPAYAETVRGAKSPGLARRLADRGGSVVLTSEQAEAWEARRVAVMERALALKFARGTRFAALLLATGDRPIVEKALWDGFWGAGRDRRGRNVLGRLLVQRREALLSC